MLEKRYTLEDEARWRRLVIAEEDRLRLRAHPWCGAGYRWFKSPNVTPLEHYRRALETQSSPPLRAA